MSKLRLSGHSLEIERGRYKNSRGEVTPREERFCKYCKVMGTLSVEDEKHFLLKCPMSKELRDNYLPQDILQNILLREEDKMTQILTDSDMNQIAKFIHLAFEQRDLNLEVLSTLQDVTESVHKNMLFQPPTRLALSHTGLNLRMG